MIVSRENFSSVLSDLLKESALACDTETTGLRMYKGDRLFSIIIASDKAEYYFNFALYEGCIENWLLRSHKEALTELFLQNRRWYFCNAKFDMHVLAQEGIELHEEAEVFCNQALGRIVRNDLFQYGMDALCKRWLGRDKSTTVTDYCATHELVLKEKEEWKKQSRTRALFHSVPLDVIAPYGCSDARNTYDLGKFVESALATIDTSTHRPARAPSILQVAHNEMRLTKTLFRMERTGVLIDREYCERALKAERDKFTKAAQDFRDITGLTFDDGPKTLTQAFEICGIPLQTTIKKGKTDATTSFDKTVMGSIDHPLAKAVLAYRQSYKKATTYYMNFLGMCDADGIIHADMQQGGTKTGRMSCLHPNLQNLSKESPEQSDLELSIEEKSYIRRAFIPPPDHCFFLPDYQQMEYRLLLDYCGKLVPDGTDIIDMIMSGVDVHQATADKLGVTRYNAKTINFMLIYGGGVAKLATALNCTKEEAQEHFRSYFAGMPHVVGFVERLREKASDVGYLYNWFGRRYTFEDRRRTYTTAPNWTIQGGCADINKISMNRCDEFLLKKKARTKLVLSIHDELGFTMHKNELDLARPLMAIMESVYPHKHLPLLCSPEYSWQSLADKVSGFPEV